MGVNKKNIEQRAKNKPNFMDTKNPLYIKADLLAHEVYCVTVSFPKHELYGITSQLRRAGLSVILNIIEGFARQSDGEFNHFCKIAFGSLKETKYLIEFCKTQKLINTKDYDILYSISEEIAKILWTIIKQPKK
jgi:four helix bundle protein